MVGVPYCGAKEQEKKGVDKLAIILQTLKFSCNH